ncbi:MAG TPA: tetratricopeptide repeat protein [Thermoanaerobaculia bacterium]|nr:tetratricopeptide repeat protein [Thermoanaerobaculia bacterium]
MTLSPAPPSLCPTPPRRRLQRLVLGILLLPSLPVFPMAQEGRPAAPTAPADLLVSEAQSLANAGDFEAAIGRYRGALEAEPTLHLARFELARVLAYLGRYEESAAEFGAVVAAAPGNGAARRGEATALLLLGRYGEARRKLEEALETLPRDGQIAHTLARLLATAPVDRVRDGALALPLALAVYEVKKTYETGETVAMAYAELGEFERAIELQRGLLAQAQGEGDEATLEKLRERLLAYLRSEPWRASSPAEIAMATEPPARYSTQQASPRR